MLQAVRKEVHSSAGFHYKRSELDEMEDPEEAHARRGAHWTFDAHAFLQAVEEIKTKGTLPYCPINPRLTRSSL